MIDLHPTELDGNAGPRPLCVRCVSGFGEANALTATMEIDSILVPGKRIPLCDEHTLEALRIAEKGE